MELKRHVVRASDNAKRKVKGTLLGQVNLWHSHLELIGVYYLPSFSFSFSFCFFLPTTPGPTTGQSQQACRAIPAPMCAN
jgi:hypothetical protein